MTVLIFLSSSANLHFPKVTVWFWDLSFQTEDNWRTITKGETLTDAGEDIES